MWGSVLGCGGLRGDVWGHEKGGERCADMEKCVGV